MVTSSAGEDPGLIEARNLPGAEPGAVVLAAHASGRQAGMDGTWFDYPTDTFVTGVLDGVMVPCVSTQAQLRAYQG